MPKREPLSKDDLAAAKRVMIALDGFCSVLPIYDAAHYEASKKVLGDFAAVLPVIPQLFNDLTLLAIRNPSKFTQYLNIIDRYIQYIRGTGTLPDVLIHLENDSKREGMTQKEYLATMHAAAEKRLTAWNFKFKDCVNVENE